MSPSLDSTGNDWVETKVKEGFEPSRAVNSVLLGKSGVPAMPEQEQAIRSAQAELADKKEVVDLMMRAEEGERPVFSYVTKLVSPSDRLDLVKALLDGQPETMGTAYRPQQAFWMWGPVEKHLATRPSRVAAPTWYWELGQGDQIIETPQQGDESSLVTGKRARAFLRNLSRGMRGTDRYTWATRMAAGIRDGKPLDAHFKGNATDTTETEQWNFTVLDEERRFTEGDRHHLVGGSFNPTYREAYLSGCGVNVQRDYARFRSSVDGPIEA